MGQGWFSAVMAVLQVGIAALFMYSAARMAFRARHSWHVNIVYRIRTPLVARRSLAVLIGVQSGLALAFAARLFEDVIGGVLVGFALGYATLAVVLLIRRPNWDEARPRRLWPRISLWLTIAVATVAVLQLRPAVDEPTSARDGFGLAIALLIAAIFMALANASLERERPEHAAA